MELEGKKVLVTGASRGIGRAIALAFASAGANVAVTAREATSLASLVEEIQTKGRHADAFTWDVSNVVDFDKRVREVVESLGGLDIVVNNAGVIGRTDFFEVTSKEWDAVMDTNLKGLYFVCQAVANFWIANDNPGRIINIASDAGLRGAPVAYGISKWGVVGLTKGLGRLLLPKGILVNAIAPGPTATEMMGWQDGKDLEMPNHPFGRLAKPDEIGDVALFLASEAANRIAGDVIVVNGGL